MLYIDTMRRSVRKPPTLSEKIESRIAKVKGDVFLRADFSDLGGYNQVGRVLQALVRSGELLKIGQGVYARAESSIINGEPVPVKNITAIVSEALNRLGVKTGPTKLDMAQSEGRTTQVPSGRLIGVNRRVRRKLGYGGATVNFQRV
jgi:hypothetical protein